MDILLPAARLNISKAQPARPAREPSLLPASSLPDERFDRLIFNKINLFFYAASKRPYFWLFMFNLFGVQTKWGIDLNFNKMIPYVDAGYVSRRGPLPVIRL